jgi:uncharacterized protein YjbI with pentapeptide repeats
MKKLSHFKISQAVSFVLLVACLTTLMSSVPSFSATSKEKAKASSVSCPTFDKFRHLKSVLKANGNYTGCDFSWGSLQGVDLSKANLKNANFTGADLSSASLKAANLTSAVLTNAVLTEANLSAAKLLNITSGNTYVASSSSGTVWHIQLPKAWQIISGYLAGPTANLSNMPRTFNRQKSATSDGPGFGVSSLSTSSNPGDGAFGMNFSGANFSNSDLSFCGCNFANFSGANLEFAIIQNISDANFVGANLKGAKLAGSFRGSNFTGADLTNADLSGAQIERAIGITR